MAGRRCPGPRCPRILTHGERYCPVHAIEYEAKRGTPTQRGYDQQHRRTRAQWQARIDADQPITCVTCGAPVTGRAWDLGHTTDRTGYLGPQCVTCNRSDGGRRGAPGSP